MATNPTPIRRSKTMPTDGPTCKFLYTIMKQLDLKSIDWNLVASQLDISNGHAARMRYSRFRQQMQIMEGITPITRTNRPRKSGSKGEKGSAKTDGQSVKHSTSASPPPVVPKLEPGIGCHESSPFESKSFIKSEQIMHAAPNLAAIPPAVPAPHMMPSPFQGVPEPMVQYPPVTTVAPTDLTLLDGSMNGFQTGFGLESHQAHPQNIWDPVKMERNDGGMGDLMVKIEQ
ncbi:hypothetical protein MPDQ_004873 [Monascus purpureus]|uniref:Myb-like DNA-binding domain-containing protein n=1 Tax=Monascus purpureus TaxID=5098 RepID=A0A507QZH0_MONPU|nr:hypothetical protein MPDQ_004873 [Monascus purpureus]BDD55857.1 hypothetical protein MAP00_001341 [Monascus purpureus]